MVTVGIQILNRPPLPQHSAVGWFFFGKNHLVKRYITLGIIIILLFFWYNVKHNLLFHVLRPQEVLTEDDSNILKEFVMGGYL